MGKNKGKIEKIYLIHLLKDFFRNLSSRFFFRNFFSMYTELLTNKLNKQKKVMATKTTAKSKITKRIASNTKRPLPFTSKVTKCPPSSTSETNKAIMHPLPSAGETSKAIMRPLLSTGESSKAVKHSLPTTSKVQVSKKKVKIPEIPEKDEGNSILLFIQW